MTHTPHTRLSRPFWVAVLLAVAVSLLFGLSSAGAAISVKKEVTVLDKSPDHPIAGRNYTITFALMRGERTFQMAKVACFAMSDHRMVPLVEEVNDGTVGHCTWAVPDKPGQDFGGMIVVTAKDGKKYYRGFDTEIQRE